MLRHARIIYRLRLVNFAHVHSRPGLNFKTHVTLLTRLACFSRAYFEKLGVAWGRGYMYMYCMYNGGERGVAWYTLSMYAYM